MPDPSYYRLFKILGQYCDQVGHGATDPLWHEIAEKLKQLAYMEERISQLNRQCGAWAARRHSITAASVPSYEEEGEADRQRLEMQIYTEAFYNSAWTLQNLLRFVPGLKRLDLKDIRLIRGPLMVHPERFIASFAYGGIHGPMIKPDKDQKFNDPGLFANSEAMRRQLFNIHIKLEPERERQALDGPEFLVGFF